WRSDSLHDPQRAALPRRRASAMWETPCRAPVRPNMRGEPGWARIGRGFWGAAIAATAIVLLCAGNSAGWGNRQFPGFFLWENLFVPAVGDTDWTGYQAGVPYRSRLLAVDGRTVTSATQVYAAAERAPADTALRYAFQLSDGTTETLAVPPMRFTLAEYL